MSWIIRQITCQDIKGFNGRYEFPFQAGLNMIHSENNQGKSSLVDSLRWALVGEYPKVVAIHAGSYSMINKNAGTQNGMPEVVVELVDTENDEEMTITRRGHKKATARNERLGLTVGQEGLEPLEVSVAGNNHTGWLGDAQAMILEQLGSPDGPINSSTLAKCSVVGQADIISMISGKETEMNNVMHDLLGLRTLVDIGPILTKGKGDAEILRKAFKGQLEGPASPLAMWEAMNSQLAEDFENKQEEVREEHGFEWDEVESNAQIEEAIVQRLADCETSLKVDFAELEIRERTTEIDTAVDELAGQDPRNERARNLGVESERIARSIEDLKGSSESWGELETEMVELLDDGELVLVALATEMQEIEKLFNEKKAEKEALDLSESLSTSVIDHLEAHSELDECPICKNPAEHAALQAAAKALMGPEIVARRSSLKSEVDALESQFTNAENKYESAEQLHASILAGVNDLSTVVERLPEGMDMHIQSAENLHAGAAAISAYVEEIQRVKAICEERQEEIVNEEGQLEEQSTTWREETLEPLRTTLREVGSLEQLLHAYRAIDTHAGRYEDAEIAHAALRSRLGDARNLKGMLHSLESALTVSQQANASQRIDEALPQINEIFGAVCANPQYDRLQVHCSIKNGSIVYSFRTLPVQRALGDVAAVVLSGGNQAVASIAVLMALAAGGSHQFPSLVLDDPSAGMDPSTRERWAVAASDFAQNQQLIVLTPEPHLADCLEENGALRLDLEGWDQGVLNLSG
jgi:hypothetical protein